MTMTIRNAWSAFLARLRSRTSPGERSQDLQALERFSGESGHATPSPSEAQELLNERVAIKTPVPEAGSRP